MMALAIFNNNKNLNNKPNKTNKKPDKINANFKFIRLKLRIRNLAYVDLKNRWLNMQSLFKFHINLMKIGNFRNLANDLKNK